MPTLDTSIDDEKFVEAWMKAYEHRLGQVDIAEQIGAHSSTVSIKAKSLRDAGVMLPRLYREKATRDEETVSRLNRLIRERKEAMTHIGTLDFSCGHPKEKGNIQIDARGYPRCRICNNRQQRNWRRKHAKEA